MEVEITGSGHVSGLIVGPEPARRRKSVYKTVLSDKAEHLAQETVMKRYRKYHSSQDLSKVHMLFSPHRIPPGIIKREMKILIWLAKGLDLGHHDYLPA